MKILVEKVEKVKGDVYCIVWRGDVCLEVFRGKDMEADALKYAKQIADNGNHEKRTTLFEVEGK